MHRTKITATNEFHSTQASAKPLVSARLDHVELNLSPGQVRRLNSLLCGVASCTCAGVIGQRPLLAVTAPSYGPVEAVEPTEGGGARMIC